MAKKSILFTVFLFVFCVIFSGTILGQDKTKVLNNKYFEVSSFQTFNGKTIEKTVISSPPKRPLGFEPMTAMLPEPNIAMGINTLTNVPAFTWCFGCSATSAAMIAGYYDRTGYSNMYTGPTNGGLMPLDNSSWGTWHDGSTNRAQCPLSATRNGLDGRVINGHVDDYWIAYGNTSPDPFFGNWTEHTYGDCTGDFMKTNQTSNHGNSDGATTFYNYPSGTRLYYSTMVSSGISDEDGGAGFKQFYESRGYTVTEMYNQYILPYGTNTSGFTYAEYCAEIDAGNPVMIHVQGHTMVGIGYDTATNKMYIHDTWDYSTHEMTWGGSYSGMAHYAVTIVNLENNSSSISISSPNVGDNWPYGSTKDITWDTSGSMASTVKITLYDSTGTNHIHTMTMDTPNDGSYSWTIPTGLFPTGNYIVRVKTTDNQVFGDSDIFAISGTINVSAPATGTSWPTNSSSDITWTIDGGMASSVKITLYDSTGTSLVNVMTLNTPNDGTYNWTIPGTIPAGNYIVRVKTTDNQVFDDSDVFAISSGGVTPAITITSPTTGNDWLAGSARDITWTTDGTMASTVKITLYDSTGSNLANIMTLNTANDGTYNWTIPGTIPAGNYIVRVKTTDNQVSDDSNVFTISSSTPTISLTSPVLGNSWAIGSSHDITWTSSGSMNSAVKLTLYDSTGINLRNILTMNTPNDGTYNWTLPDSFPAGHYILRIKTVDNAVFGESEMFVITGGTSPSVVLTAPDTGVTWVKNTTQTITWTKSGTQAANVKITLYDQSGLNLAHIMTMSTPNDGSYNWTIPTSIAAGDYIVRIKTTDNVVFDNSYLMTISN